MVCHFAISSRTTLAPFSRVSFSSAVLMAATTSFFCFKFSCSTTWMLVDCFFFSSKKWSQAAMKRFHTASLCFFTTGPTVFHSFCSSTRASVVFFQSVESFRASAFSHNSVFLARFAANWSFISLKNSAFLAKNSSHDFLKRANSSEFSFLAAKPIFFHSACNSIIWFVALSQAAYDLNSSGFIDSIFSHNASFASALLFSCSFRFSK